MRLFLRAFGRGSDPQESDLLSYLLFDGNFLGPIAELGFSDARAREDELAAFFSDEPLESES